jgi:hypothetical protein
MDIAAHGSRRTEREGRERERSIRFLNYYESARAAGVYLRYHA